MPFALSCTDKKLEQNATVTQEGNTVRFAPKAGTKGMSEQLKVVYGDTQLDVDASTPLAEIKNAMAEIFPAKLSQGTWCQPRGSWQAWLAQQATSEARALPSPLPVKDRFPSLFYKSFNIAFVFEIMEKPQVKKAGIKNLSQTGCVHTAPS